MTGETDIDTAPAFIAPQLLASSADGPVRLRAGKCKDCGSYSFPPSPVCANCLAENIAQVTLGTEGVLYAYSIVHQAPRGWDVPYALGYVDLPEGIRVLAHLDVPFAKLRSGSAVTIGANVVGRDGLGNPLRTYTFRLKDSANA
jgi:uncharacterized OB-fold protein